MAKIDIDLPQLKSDNDVKITQVNEPHSELTELEKTAIMQFEIEKEEEKLSKTMEFKLLNSKKKKNDFELPKKKVSLGDTIKLKLSDLRAEIELPKEKKKSLYDTIIIKLDDLINKNDNLKIKKETRL